MQNILCTIEARMNSSRLPGKVLKKINNTTVLEILFERVKKCKKINNIVLATTRNKIDDKIVKICKKNGINYYRGSEKNVLQRIIKTSEKFKGNIIVQLTADNPIVDPEMIDYMINFFLKNKKVDYLTNNGMGNFELRNVPYGQDVQIFYSRHLQKNLLMSKQKKELLEHPSLFFYREGKAIYNLMNINLPKKFFIDKFYRLTIDHKKDFELIKIIYQYFNKKKKYEFKNKDILYFLKKNPKIAKINAHHQQKTVNLLHDE